MFNRENISKVTIEVSVVWRDSRLAENRICLFFEAEIGFPNLDILRYFWVFLAKVETENYPYIKTLRTSGIGQPGTPFICRACD